MSDVGWLCAAAMLVLSARGQAQPSPGIALSYAAAQERFLARSDAIEAASAGVRAKEAQQRATRSLAGPDIEVEVQAIDFQKTLYLPLGSLAPVAQSFGIPDPLRFQTERFLVRPIVTATLPIYAGGQIGAAQAGAAAQVAQATADKAGAVDNGLAGLAQAYFSRQLAAEALTVRRAVVRGITRHVADARALEREQQIAPAQRLQAEAALEEAEREADKAEADVAAADAALRGLLRSDAPILPTTPLEAEPAALPPAEDFVAAALGDHPMLKRLQATSALAQAGISTEKAKLRPTVYALGQVNLNPRNTLVTDPDFIFGLGAKFKIASGLGRRSQVAAARATAAQAEAGVREAQSQLETGVTVAWTRAESARRRHALYDRTIRAADENLRVARLSFRELQGTSRDVTDAEIGAGRVRVERAKAAYEYVDALTQLLRASGQVERLPEFLSSVAAREP